MKQNEVKPLDLGDELLPWLQRVDDAIRQQPAERRVFYGQQTLERLKETPFAQDDFFVDSNTVLGREPDRPENSRFLFAEGFIFFGKLALFGYMGEQNQDRIRGLTLVFSDAEAINYEPPAEDAEGFRVIAFEVPVRQVNTLIKT